MAPALGLKLGDVVMMNLIYQIEHIGLNCSASNNTGPVPNCPAEKKKWDAARDEREKGPGLCTSIVARDQVWVRFPSLFFFMFWLVRSARSRYRPWEASLRATIVPSVVRGVKMSGT